MKSAKTFLTALSLFLDLCVSGCFTGIESTPKITAENIKDADLKISAEQRISDMIVAEPTEKWTKGKKWIVTDKKISLAFTPATDSADDLTGDTLSLDSVRTFTNVTGRQDIELSLTDTNGNTFIHRTNIEASEWPKRDSYQIPFTVELSAVELADSILKGTNCFIVTPRWQDSAGNDITGLRHVEVNIVGVIPGNHVYPLTVVFSPEKTGSNEVRYIPMTFGLSTAATRNFDRIFSFTNPRKTYPGITDATWNLIIHSQIAEGMTRDECRLALGAPDSVVRTASPGAQLERWSYNNGVYLLFEDGYLTKFRK